MALSGCFFQADEVTPTGALIKEQTAAEFAKEREANGVKVYEVQISGNQFQLTGKNLKGAKVARLKGTKRGSTSHYQLNQKRKLL